MTDELEQLHNLELLLASEVLKICEKYNLKIVMLAGTFLGAIRHNGFIPWDDDMDFGMPREELKWSIYHELLKSVQLKSRIHWQLENIKNGV